MTDKEILIRAKELLVKRGWCQGEYEDSQGRICLSKSVNLVESKLKDRRSVRILIKDLIVKPNGPFISIPTWNDVPERTKEEVFSLLDRAIEKAQEDEISSRAHVHA